MLANLPTLHTARLTLRPFVLQDADTVRALAGDYKDGRFHDVMIYGAWQ
ncbi:MAG: hypothetical protein RI964_506 [Pseudomonadota bacterium]|jgi:hypothetical protein